MIVSTLNAEGVGQCQPRVAATLGILMASYKFNAESVGELTREICQRFQR